MNIEVNYLSILVAGIVSMILGFLWYHPILLGKPWMRLAGHTPEGLKSAQKEMGKWYALSFIVSLITAYMLAHVMGLSENYFHYSPVTTAFSSAFSMWLGFIMPVQLADQIFGQKKIGLFAINTGYQLVALILMGIVIALI